MGSISKNKLGLNINLASFLKKTLKTKLSALGDLLALVANSPRSATILLGASVDGRNIKLGHNTFIESGATLSIQDRYSDNEFIRIGNNCEIRRGAQIRSWSGWISIADECSINPNTILYGTGGLKIGNFVRIAGNCLIVASEHVFTDCSRPICRQGYTAKGITIEDDVWIGAGVCILDGVTIGRGSIIAAGSVVRDSVDEYSINAGVPSKKIKSRK